MTLRTYDRAGQVPKDRVYENFRNPGWRQNHKSAQQRRDGNNPNHLKAIRKLTCSVCEERRPHTVIDPHHLKMGVAAAERSFGRRSTDQRCVPLCRVHHNAAETFGQRGCEHEFWHQWSYDAEGLAERLWRESPNIPRMEATVKEFKLRSIREQAEILRWRRKGLTPREAQEQIKIGLL